MITIENCYLDEKENKAKNYEKFRKFVDSGIVKTCDEHDLDENRFQQSRNQIKTQYSEHLSLCGLIQDDLTHKKFPNLSGVFYLLNQFPKLLGSHRYNLQT